MYYTVHGVRCTVCSVQYTVYTVYCIGEGGYFCTEIDTAREGGGRTDCGGAGRKGGRNEGRLENWIGRVWQERGGRWGVGGTG